MSKREWDREYCSHADFYKHVYGQHATALRQIESGGTTLIEARQSAGGSLHAQGVLLQLAARLLRLRNHQEPKFHRGLAPWQVRRVSEYLEGNLAEDVSLADLGKLLDLSTFHVCRAFKQSTGLPPHRWRQQKRMERARELLEGTNLAIMEIAAAVGYDDPSQLAAAFRKAFGVTPTQHRRERRS